LLQSDQCTAGGALLTVRFQIIYRITIARAQAAHAPILFEQISLKQDKQ
jgi:hypothetical protein